MAQYRDLEAFAAFASDLDEASKAQLARGERLVELLKQGQYSPYEAEEQVLVIYAATNGYCDGFTVQDVQRYEKELLQFAKQKHSGILDNVRTQKKLNDEIKASMDSALKDFAAIFEPSVKKA